MKHCGRENCEGRLCKNWGTCRGETIPPWDCGPHRTTASTTIREQDVLASADILAECASEFLTHKDSDECQNNLCNAIVQYTKERKGSIK